MQSTIITVVLTGLLAALSANAQASSVQPQLAAAYGKLPLSFEPNRGQTDSRVQFIVRGAGYSIFLRPNSAAFALHSAVVRMDLLGANDSLTMESEDKLPGTATYLMGSNRTKWPAHLSTYAKTRSHNVYPGIDLVYYGTQGSLEYDFVLAPHADPSKIRLTFAGAVPTVDKSGDLLLSVAGKDSLRFHKPQIYQRIAGARQPVDGGFTLSKTHEVSFQIAAYERTRELVIDPVLAYSSYLGGSSQQSVINGMTIDAAGEIYVTGVTNALDYPTTAGVIESDCPAPNTGGTKCGPSSSSAAFVSKISADGQTLIYSTYLGGGGSGPGVGGSAFSEGGSGSDFGSSIAVDANGNAWILGGTNSNNFPVTPDAFSLYCEPATADLGFSSFSGQDVGELSNCARFNSGNEYIYSGTYSLFLVKLDPTGDSILYGTFLGGTQGETPGQIAIDTSGNIYVSGSAYSAAVGTPAATGQFLYPTTSTAFQPVPQGSASSAFVTVLSPDGQSLIYSSFLSAAAGQTYGGPLAIGAGRVFIGGVTQTPSLPTTPGALSTTCPGTATQCQNNGFVAEFDPTKSGDSSLVFSTYLNGKHVSTVDASLANSTVAALAADSSGNVYAAGSNQYRDFPTTPGVLQPSCNADRNDSCSTGFVTKLNSAGALVWSTFYGSPSASGQFGVSAIALDGDRNVYIAGQADGAGDLPLSNSFQNYTSGVAYVTELNADASNVVFGSFFGSGGSIYPTALAVDTGGNIYLAGYTASALPLVNALQSTNGGGFNEGFFAKITGAPKAATFVSAATNVLGTVAAGSIVSAYGLDLATETDPATTVPLPLTLGGTIVDIVDAAGVSTPAPLFFVSQGQVNFEIPSTVADGIASINITSGDGTVSSGTAMVAAVAPGLFVLNADGLVAANFITVFTDGSEAYGDDFQIVNNAIVPLAIDLSPPAQTVYLVLYGTGIAGRSSLPNVSVSIGGLILPVAYAGPQGEVGLDQVNVQIPLSLAGLGSATITVTVDGVVSNTALITIM